MNFAESIEYLYNLGYELSVKKFGLENTLKLLKRLENPEKNYLKIQIAGTNGKGSTCAFLEAICVSAKIKVGKYTSPHLVSITERISVDGVEISEEKFAEHATRVRKVSEKLVETGELETVPTFFEQVTAIALLAFAKENVEIAILETGLGGRFDATTAARAEIVGITPISLDHQNILGNSLTEITREKAAVIREDTEIIVAKQPAAARDVIFKRCAELGISKQLMRNLQSRISSGGGLLKTPDKIKISKLMYPTVSVKIDEYKSKQFKISLPGKHQAQNAKLAFHLAEVLQERGFVISDANLIEGLQTAKHKGRLEFYENFLFDGAHNISGAKALREFLDEFIEQPITMIFGAMKEKDLTEIGEILFPVSERLILTKPENPRAMEVAELAKFVPKEFNKDNVYQIENAADALEKAQKITGKYELILVTGSLYLIGEVQKIIGDY